MDEFAQSREDDDLFADEFEPVEQPSFVPTETSKLIPETQIPRATEQSVREPHSDRRQDGRGRGQDRRGRGGNGRGRGAQNGLGASKYADPAPAPVQASNPISQPTTSTTTTPTPENSSADATQAPDPPHSIPSEPTNPVSTTTNTVTSTRTPAVRGDRSATGGPAHKKLTEEELTAKLEKMAIINAQKAERHRLSEADQAAFQHREKELAKERREKAVAEKRNERAMEMERAKNRERKMKARGGREWDEGKTEADIVDGRGRGRSSEYVRGGHGGIIHGGSGLAGSRYADKSEVGYEAQSARGRGTSEIRGRGGGRGGRGGRVGKPSNVVPTSGDFPALPSAVKSPISKPTGDWADEMATPVEKKNVP